MSREQFERLLEELDQRDLALLTASELAQLVTVTGRCGGLARDDEPPEEVRITIVRDEVPLPDWGTREVPPALPEAPIAGPLLPPPPRGPSKPW